VRYALSSVEGVAEVASIGGHVQEYQIDVDPDALRANGVTLTDVFRAVGASNADVGARTIELNGAEYVVRGRGLLKGLSDIENTVVAVSDNVPITLRQLGTVQTGPALRRGALDKGGAEAVGGVVVVRYGANPLAVIQRVKDKIREISKGLPSKVLEDGRTSQVAVVPFYDRTGLIYETLGTLHSALELEILVSIIVVLVMVGHFRSALLISGLLPIAVLIAFIAMKQFGVDANVVALSGIAIAIGTMVDVGIVLTENILKHMAPGQSSRERFESVFQGASEVGGAVLTAVLTTVVSFLPVFSMEGAEGKLFKPLAYTKSFALIASILVALVIIPPAAHWLFREGKARRLGRRILQSILLGIAAAISLSGGRWWLGLVLVLLGGWPWVKPWVPTRLQAVGSKSSSLVAALVIGVVLAGLWQPLGPGHAISNTIFTVLLLGSVLFAFQVLLWVYEPTLRWCLGHKRLFLSLPLLLLALGATIWLGFPRLAAPVAGPLASLTNAVRAVLPTAVVGDEPVRAEDVMRWRPWVALAETFPGLGKEFMPRLDEGSFLLMPVTMAHASIGEAFDMVQQQDMLIRSIPEVEEVVGKIGRVESPLDPAPISMVETIITYKPEYKSDQAGKPLHFAFDADSGTFPLDAQGDLIPDPDGRVFRQWRDSIQTPQDIWEQIKQAATVPGMTTASMLQPMETRQIMLQTGMRSPMGIKVYGPDLETIEGVALEFEKLLQDVPSIRPETVYADRVIGKPYLEIHIDRSSIARYGLSVRAVQDVIEVAVGGKRITTTVEGRERYPVRVRYQRELRDSVDDLGSILVPTPTGLQVPLGQLAEIRYTPGPQNIKSEDNFLVAYVLFDKQPGLAEVNVVEEAQAHLDQVLKSGAYSLPAGSE